MTKLDHYLGKIVLVSIPGLTRDPEAHPYRLLGIEPYGLWLESDTFSANLAAPDKHSDAWVPRTALVPFTQIAYVVCESPVYASPVPAPAVPPAKAARHTGREPARGDNKGRGSKGNK